MSSINGKLFPTPKEILPLFEKLEDKIDEFNSVWPKYVVEAFAYELPFYEIDLVTQQTIIPDIVSPREVRERVEAIALMKDALSRFNLDKAGGQQSKNVYRLPSVAIVTSLDVIKPLIDEINDIKSELKGRVGVYSTAGRNHFTKRVLPGKVMLQVYRQIYYFDYPVRKLLFSWASKAVSYKKLTLNKAIDYIDKYCDNLNPILSEADNSRMKENIKEKLVIYADKGIRLRRELAPTPRLKAQPLYPNKIAEIGVSDLFNCSIPIFVSQQEFVPEITPLKDVIVRSEAETRLKRSSLVAIEPKLRLYGVSS